MSFTRWGYQIEGAFISQESLEARAGVYVIWCKNGEAWTVLDVGETGDVKERVATHDRVDCWARHCSGTIYYSAIYTPNLQQSGRMAIEQGIRELTKPPCGER